LPRAAGQVVLENMRAVVQRVKEAWVTVEGQVISRIGRGLLILLGVQKDDEAKDVSWLAGKIANLRVFEDQAGKLNLSVQEIGGEILVVSNFTICGDCRKGRRPSFDKAAPPEKAEALYEDFCKALEELGLTVKRGQFRAYMQVGLVNDGPVTLLLDSKKVF